MHLNNWSRYLIDTESNKNKTKLHSSTFVLTKKEFGVTLKAKTSTSCSKITPPSLSHTPTDYSIIKMMSLRIANNMIQVTDKAMPNLDQMMKEV